MTNMDLILSSVRQLRASYRAVCRALPWLDMAVWPDDPPAFPNYAHPALGELMNALTLEPNQKGRLASLRVERAAPIARFSPAQGAFEDTLQGFAAELAQVRMPLVVLHTDVVWDTLEAAAMRYPKVNFIIESGTVKLLYHIHTVEAIMLRRPNVWLCLFNLCNWLGLERLVEKGLAGRLLFGAHQPRYSPLAVMGPIVMSGLNWETKCDLAGNNLRRLLDMAPVKVGEVQFVPPAPFIVDAHAHSGPSVKFTAADEYFAPADWLAYMDSAGLAQICLCPMETILDPACPPRKYCEALLKLASGRVRYFDVFHPRGDAAQRRRLLTACMDSNCVGIKIHPSIHQVEADDESYAPVYELAETYGRPILTHSWDVSATNPAQYMSHPDRFRKHLSRHPAVSFVLGHAGGRPGSLPSVAALCREFPGVRVDLAGDYYDNGLIECLADQIGAERIIFGSDLNWIDPRANLGPVLASALADESVARIIARNAGEVYKNVK